MILPACFLFPLAKIILEPGYKIALTQQKIAVRKVLPSNLLLTVSCLSYTLEVSFIFINWSIPIQFRVHFHLQLYLVRCQRLLVIIYSVEDNYSPNRFNYYSLRWLGLFNFLTYLGVSIFII